MALTSDETRRVYLHCGALQVTTTGGLVGGVPMLTEQTHQIQTAIESLTANGETTVRELLDQLDTLRTGLFGSASKAGIQQTSSGESSVTFSGEEFEKRREIYEWARKELMNALGYDPTRVPSTLGSSDMQGPWREP